jgi:hypothetical protein
MKRAHEEQRSHYVGAPAIFHLSNACVLINESFGDFGCYLVGSALERRDYRDVDVRFIMDDEARIRFLTRDGI